MKVGVIGHGSIGRRHAENLRQLGHDPVIYDPVYGAGLRFERHVYETCPAVVIATPTLLHWGCIRAAAERGCHMLVEKPIASGDVRDLQKSLDLAKSKGAVVMVGNNLRFHPCVVQAKNMIEAIGEPRWAFFICATESVKPLYLSDGVILNTGAHEVDMALHLLGPAEVVSASAKRAPPGNDYLADFVLEHQNGTRSNFHLDFVTPVEIRQTGLSGTAGSIAFDLPQRVITYNGNAMRHEGSYDDDYMAEMRAFIDRIEGKETLGATGVDGLETLKILLKVRKMAGLP